jgi:F-type H+-transporting ATPase subunit delta
MSSDVASAYALTLFELASLADSVDPTDESMVAVVSAVRGNLDLREALTDSSVPAETRRAVLRDIFGPSVSPEALAIVTLIADRGQVSILGDVAKRFREIAEAERGIIVAEITTAIALDDAQRASLSDNLAGTLGSPVSIRETVDASIVGGIIVKVAGRVLDGSVASQLESVRRTLATAQGGES